MVGLLQSQETSFQLLFDNNPLPMWVYDLVTLQFLDVNDAAVSVYGYSQEEFLKMRITDIRPTDDVARLQQNLVQQRPALQDSGEWRHRRKDGQIIDVLIVSHTLDVAGHTAALVVAQDITERKRAQAALSEGLKREQTARAQAEAAQQRLSFLLEASALLAEEMDYRARLRQLAYFAVPTIADWCAVDVVGDDGVLERVAVVHVDPAKIEFVFEVEHRYPPDKNAPGGAYQVLRSGQSQLYSDIPDALIIASARDEHHLNLIRELGLRSALTVPLLSRNGALGVFTLVMAESGRYYDHNDLALAEDLARRAGTLIENARLYQEAQKLNTELEHRVRERTAELETAVDELEGFSYSVSHDLRAPLRHVGGYVALLQSHAAAAMDEKGRRYLTVISDATERMGTLIDDLLAFSRIGRTEMHKARVKLNDLVQDVLRDFQPDIQDRTIVWNITPLPTVYGDRALLRQVLVNLISNAIKYTRPRPQAEIEIGCTESGSPVEFFIRDNGVGFDMKYIDKLFGVFQRLHSMHEFEGTGIGLANVRRIVQRHGGTIRVEAALDQGATFYITLPSEDGGLKDG